MRGLLILSVLVFSSLAKAERQFHDFIGTYKIKSCRVEVNLSEIEKDPYCHSVELQVKELASNEFQLLFILPSGQILSEGALTQFEHKENGLEDQAAFRGDVDSGIWFRSYKNSVENLFIDEKYEFWVSPKSGEISFIRAHGHVQNVDYKFTRWDYELEKM